MKYYKHIDIDGFSEIQTKTYEYIKLKDFTSVGFFVFPYEDFTFHCPEIITAFDRYNLKPKAVAIYTTYNQEDSKVHIDYINPEKPLCRINIPILNCEGSRTEFYSGGNYSTFQQKNGYPYLLINEGDDTAVKVDEVEIIKPTVIRVQEPHRVFTNMNAIPRICMSVQFYTDPVFLLEDDQISLTLNRF